MRALFWESNPKSVSHNNDNMTSITMVQMKNITLKNEKKIKNKKIIIGAKIWSNWRKLCLVDAIPHMNSETNTHPQVSETVSWYKLRYFCSSNMLQHWEGGEGARFISAKWTIPELQEIFPGIYLDSIIYVRYCHKIWGSW